MATRYGKRIVTDGLVLCLDAADNISAPHNDLPVKQGLLAWWDAADDSTVTLSGSNVTQWRDKSGNDLHMAPNGTGPTRSNTLNSKSILTFTASQDIRNFDAALNLNAVDNTVIVVSRYTYSSGSNNGRVLDGGANNWLLGHWSSATQKYYALGWVSSSSNNVNNDNTWRIYTGTGDIGNDVWQFKVNGTDSTSISSGGSQGPKYLAINSGNSSNQASDCDVAELIVFNRVLSSDELTKVHNYLKNKWNISVSDAKWYDRTANANNGTLTNDPTYSETNKGYFDFDGSDQYINCGTISSGNSLYISQGSIELWFKYSTSQNGVILGWGDASTNWGNIAVTNNWTGSVSNESIAIGSRKSSTDYYIFYVTDGADYYGDGNWHHLVFTKGVDNSTNIACYIDGVQKTMSVAKVGTGAFFLDNVASSLINIGRRPYSGGSEYYNGNVASIKIYSDILTQAEALQNYNATKGRYL